MGRYIREHLGSGDSRLVIVGSDVPGVDAELLSAAFGALEKHDLVIGPAHDGGYYLIGLRTDVPELFENIPWGTNDVFHRTLAAAKRRELSICTLPTLADVDRPEDFDVLKQAWGSERFAEATGTISVIIPTLNEEVRIKTVLEALRPEDRSSVEIVLVDGRSTDGTRERAAACGAKVLVTAPGRARQMNAGADAATGGIFLFLHGDTRLPKRFDSLVRAALRRSGVAAGAFQFRLDANGRPYRILEGLVNWRSRVLQMPYGDQALFTKAGMFRAVGGFPDLPIMEDFEMVRRLRRIGKLVIIPASVVTSARRWQERGFLRTTLLNQLVIVGFYLRLRPQTLGRWYHGRETAETVP
jgi:rSAM/selenodomain-associated transferase 2